MSVKEETAPRASAKGSQVSFWEIFKHAWPILFERPKPLIVLVAVLAAATQAADEIASVLQAPYLPYFEAFGKSLEQQAADTGGALREGFEALGYTRLIIAGLVPCFLAPFLWLTMCQASLSIWDGWSVGLQNAAFAIRRYFTGLKILLIISFFAIFLFLFSMLTLLPLFLVQGLAGGGAMASNWLLTLMGAAAGLFFFVKILWPHLRRFLLLQFLIYFRLTDGETGPWAGRIWRLYEVLRSYPSHMNQGVAVFLMTFLGAGLISAIIVTMLTMAGIPPLLSKFFGNAILFLGLLWPFTALAGFHRLILSPMESSSEAAYADRSVTD